MSRGSAFIGFLLCFLGGVALMWGLDRSSHAGTTPDVVGGIWSNDDAKIPISSKDPYWGSADAPVTLVLYSDFQCSYCSKIEPTLADLREKYGKSKLRIVWKHFPLPFHEAAGPAAAASQIVFELGGSDAFWKFHDLAFEHQGDLSPANFSAWAATAGVDKAKFDELFKAGKGKDKVDADMAFGKTAGVRGTPSFFLNGKFLSGTRPTSAFESEIDAQLKEAERLVAAGTPRERVYTTLTNKNYVPPPSTTDEGDPRPDAGEDTKTVWKIPLTGKEPQKGNPDAPVTIVQFAEYQCPFCAKVLPTVRQLLEAYKDKVRLVFLDNPLPFHKRAVPAAMLAHEARAQKGDKAFWEAYDLLFANQKLMADEDLWAHAGTLGLNVDKVKTAIERRTHRAVVERGQSLADDLDADTTPQFFINGRRLMGALPIDKFKQVIDEEIVHGETLLRQGTKPQDLYAELIKDGRLPPPPPKKDPGPIPEGAPWKGGREAKVVIHAFFDLEDPHCARINGTLKEILETYGKQVKIVFRNKPLSFHKDAPLAHQAAMEAHAQLGNEGFWKMHDKLLQNQKALSRSDLEDYAREVQLDITRFKKALDAGTHKAAVDADARLSEKIGIQGTPGFIVGQYYLSGAQSFARFKKVIELTLKESR